MKLNNIIIDKIKEWSEFKLFMDYLDINSDTIIIKPNWVDAVEGSFSEAKVLELFFEYFKNQRIILIEGYSAWRNKPSFNGKNIIPTQINLKTIKNKWRWIKQQDDWFLQEKKIKPLLKKYNVEYINITEEVWSGKTVKPKIIGKLVESKFSRLKFSEFYSYMPTRLFKLKDAKLISLAKMKTESSPFGITASTKNLFGLIPNPSRWNYHGKNHQDIPESIVDISKVYRTLFNCVFIVEGIFTATTNYMGKKPKLVEDWGFIIGGKNSAEVDAVAATMAGVNYKNIEYLPLTIKTFGNFNKSIFSKIPKDYIKKLK